MSRPLEGQTIALAEGRQLEELAQLLARLPGETAKEKRDRALVQFLISTGCRISEALALDRTDVPRQGKQ